MDLRLDSRLSRYKICVVEHFNFEIVGRCVTHTHISDAFLSLYCFSLLSLLVGGFTCMYTQSSHKFLTRIFNKFRILPIVQIWPFLKLTADIRCLPTFTGERHEYDDTLGDQRPLYSRSANVTSYCDNAMVMVITTHINSELQNYAILLNWSFRIKMIFSKY